MPCNSDHMQPTKKEEYRQKTCHLYAYALTTLGREVPEEVVRGAGSVYTSHDPTAALCELLQGLSDDGLERVVYNAHSADSRRLADWWEAHQEADRIREEKDAHARWERRQQYEALKREFEPEDAG